MCFGAVVVVHVWLVANILADGLFAANSIMHMIVVVVVYYVSVAVF